MTLYYSKSTNGFYNDTVHVTMPSDVVSITEEIHQALLQGQSQGNIITVDFNGNPINSPAPVQEPNYILLAKNALKKSDNVATRCWKAGITFPSEWITYDSLLRNIVLSGVGPLPQQPAYPAGT